MFFVTDRLICVGRILIIAGIVLTLVFFPMSQNPGGYVMLTGIILAAVGYIKEYNMIGKK